MDDSQGDGTRTEAAEELILRTIAAHAESLLRTARRHSICVEDAQDAYQRSIEIFMAHAQRLDPARAAGWLHVVIKREAQAIRNERQKLLTCTEVDLDGREALSLPTPEERLLSFDMLSRSAEALKRLKPHQLRALWLRAQGHSYAEIEAITGWSYSKVNRCMAEGRRAFLARYEGIESGAECERWLPVISAMVDGEASPEQLLDLRPHLRNCPGCRATLKALQDSKTPLAALFAVPLLVSDGDSGDRMVTLLMRIYEGLAGGLHERAVNSVTKAQALIEASAAGKVAAVAASAAAVAGGGYASVERVIERPAHAKPVARAAKRPGRPPSTPSLSSTAPSSRTAVVHRVVVARSVSAGHPRRNEFGGTSAARRSAYAPEFRGERDPFTARHRLSIVSAAHSTPISASSSAPSTPPAPRAAPEFADRGSAPEFAP